MEALNATAIVCHHFRKTKADYGPADLDDLTGAGVGEHFRQWMLLSRREEYKDDGKHAMWMRVGGSGTPGSLYAFDADEGVPDRITRVRISSGMSRSKIRLTFAKCKLLRRMPSGQSVTNKSLPMILRLRWQCLRRIPMDCQQAAIAKKARIGQSRYEDVITAMVERGLIVPAKIKVGNQTTLRDGYKLAADASEE